MEEELCWYEINTQFSDFQPCSLPLENELLHERTKREENKWMEEENIITFHTHTHT
jgi:hypothetical protein